MRRKMESFLKAPLTIVNTMFEIAPWEKKILAAS